MWLNLRFLVIAGMVIGIFTDSEEVSMLSRRSSVLISFIALVFGIVFAIFAGATKIAFADPTSVLKLPQWNSSPFDKGVPFQFEFFGFYFFGAGGLAALIRDGFQLGSEGFIGIALALGLYAGVRIVKRIYISRFS